MRLRLNEQDETLNDVFNSFLAYYEQNEMFDLYIHRTRPGLVGVVVNSLKSYLGWYVDTKLDRELPVDLNKKCSLEVYINKIKAIVAKVVCDQEEGTEDNGRLKKMVEEVAKLTKEKKKSNVKYTDCKPSAMTSKQSVDNATISSDEESSEEYENAHWGGEL